MGFGLRFLSQSDRTSHPVSRLPLLSVRYQDKTIYQIAAPESLIAFCIVTSESLYIHWPVALLLQSVKRMTTTTNDITIPSLNLRAERVYQWVENQTHARTRTARGIQELRLSTTNAERRLSELQCLSARLAQDAA